MTINTFNYHPWRIFSSIIIWFIFAICSAAVWVVDWHENKDRFRYFYENGNIVSPSSYTSIFTNDVFLYGLPLLLFIYTLFFWKIQQKIATKVSFKFTKDKLIFSYGNQTLNVKYSKIKTVSYDSSSRLIGGIYDSLDIQIPNQFSKKIQLKNDQNRGDLDKLEFISKYLNYKIKNRVSFIELSEEKISQVIRNEIEEHQSKLTDSYYFILPNALLILVCFVFTAINWSQENYFQFSISLIAVIFLIIISIKLHHEFQLWLAISSFLFTLSIWILIHLNDLHRLSPYIVLILIVEVREIYKNIDLLKERNNEKV